MNRKEMLAKMRQVLREHAQVSRKSKDGKPRSNRKAVLADASAVLNEWLKPRRPPEVTRQSQAPAERKWANRFLSKHFTSPIHVHKENSYFSVDPRRAPAQAIRFAQANRYKAFGGGMILDLQDDGSPQGALISMDETLKELQQLHDQVYLFHCIMQRGNEEYRQNPRKALKRTGMWKRWMAAVEPLAKAMTSTGSGVGDEWVPTGWSQDFIDQVLLGAPASRLFPVINMPTNPFDVFGLGALPVAYSPAEGSAPSAASAIASRKVSLSADIYKAYDTFTDEVDEDSAVEIVGRMQQQLQLALTMGIETAVINGDSTATHGDNDVHGGAADHAAKSSHIGLRHSAMDNSYTYDWSQTSSPALSHLLATRSEMGKGFAENPREHVWLTSSQGYLQNIIRTAEVKTQDLFGMEAVIRTGAVASIAGSDVMLSHMFPENLHDTGVNASGQANDTTGILCVHQRSAMVGFRRQARIETDKVITTGVNTVVASLRFAFGWRYNPTSYASIGYGINVRTASTA